MSDGVSIYILYAESVAALKARLQELQIAPNYYTYIHREVPTQKHDRTVRCIIKWIDKVMSFVRNIFNKMSAADEKEDAADLEEDDDVSEGTSTESSDTGIFTAMNSDLESSGHALDADCSAISNFFGYW